MKHCVVVGGGLAGLAAALRLSKAEYSVTLFEGAPALGGRARSFIDRSSGMELDNGQHVLMGCYRSTLDYLSEAGISLPQLRRMRGLALPFLHSDGRRSLLQAGGLPHPLALVQAFLRYDMLPLRARVRILRVALRLRSLRGEALSVLDRMNAAEWLSACGQKEEEIECFWSPVILATMNTEATAASARLFAVVLREIFLGAPDAADMLLPEVGLSTLLIDPVRDVLEVRGVTIRCSSAITAVESEREGGVVRVRAVRSGDERISADAVVSAIPPWTFPRLEIVTAGADTAAAASLNIVTDAFTPSEILSVHIWLRRDLGNAAMTGLLGSMLQWVFFKGKTDVGLFHYSCTVSAARGDETVDETALRSRLLEELRMLDADLQDGDIVRILPIREKRATFVPAPGLEALRPATKTAIRGFFLAGDWTATGLPATIEGAVRSGFSAAEAVLLNDD